MHWSKWQTFFLCTMYHVETLELYFTRPPMLVHIKMKGKLFACLIGKLIETWLRLIEVLSNQCFLRVSTGEWSVKVKIILQRNNNDCM